ncbi:MAG: hypothetical protein R2838_19865 [Caldilineaceae bacterium]
MAGQFNMLYVFGIGGSHLAERRSGRKPGTITHTTRCGHRDPPSKLQPGDVLGLRGPFGSHWPLTRPPTATWSLSPAASAGAAAPGHLPTAGPARRGFSARWCYSTARNLRKTCSTARRTRPSAAPADLDIHVTVDRATGGWFGNVGLVTDLVPCAPFDLLPWPWSAAPRDDAPHGGQLRRRRGRQPHLRLHGAQHEMRHRHLRSPSVRPHFICRDGPVFRFDDIAPSSAKGRSEMKPNANPARPSGSSPRATGCQLSLLDCEDELMAGQGPSTLPTSRCATCCQRRGSHDISLVEGSITTPDDAAYPSHPPAPRSSHRRLRDGRRYPGAAQLRACG